MTISPMTSADWPEVAAIYQQGIDTGNATFAPAPPAAWEDWNKSKLNKYSRVARSTANGDMLGWVAISPTSARKVYAGVVEVSIYIANAARGQGVGSRLMDELIRITEADNIWTLTAGIYPENEASLRLHYAHGFRLVGRREKVGYMEFGPFKGQWRDVLLLERRSKVAGIGLPT